MERHIVTIAPGIIAPNGPPPIYPLNPHPSIIVMAGKRIKLNNDLFHFTFKRIS